MPKNFLNLTPLLWRILYNMVPKIHTLKIKHKYLEDIKLGLKTFEIRKNDRDFQYEADTDFVKEIAPCRTFVFLHELEPLFKYNLIKGGDLDNALVIVEHPVPQEELDRLAGIFNVTRLERVPEGYLSHTSLRFQNECARHKLLDVLGDFSLVGYPIKGKVIAYKSGHSINSTIARELRTLALKQFRRRWNEQ